MVSLNPLRYVGIFGEVDPIGYEAVDGSVACFFDIKCALADEVELEFQAGPVDGFNTHITLIIAANGTAKLLAYHLMEEEPEVAKYVGDRPFGFKDENSSQLFWVQSSATTGRFTFGVGPLLGESTLLEWTADAPFKVSELIFFIADEIDWRENDNDNAAARRQKRHAFRQIPSQDLYNDKVFVRFFPPARVEHPWTPDKDFCFPAPVRHQAYELLKLGVHVRAGHGQALLDCWLAHVMPRLLGVSFNDDYVYEGHFDEFNVPFLHDEWTSDAEEDAMDEDA